MKLLVFIFFLVVFLASNGGHLDVVDGKGYFLLTENLVLHQSFLIRPDLPSIEETNFNIKNYFNWQYGLQNNFATLPEGDLQPMYIFASPLLSVIGIPFYLFADVIDYSPVQITSYFLNSIILALTATMVFTFSNEIFHTKKIAFVLALATGLCSFTWPYVSSFFQQPLVGLMLISCLYFLYMASKNKIQLSSLISGIFLGLIILSNVGYLILIPGIIVVAMYIFRKSLFKIPQFFLGFLPFVGIQLYLNDLRFGSVFDFGYGHVADISFHSAIDGLYGMFLSPGFGLITNFPLILLVPVGLYYAWKHNKVLALTIIYIFCSVWIFYGTEPSPAWHGMGAWGPRYLVPIIPVIVISLGFLLKELSSMTWIKNAFIVLGSIGFFINFLGTMVWYQAGYAFAWSLLRIQTLPAPEFLYFEWAPQFLPVVLHWNVLTTDWWTHLPPIYDGWIPCIPDNFLYCHIGMVGLIPVLLLVIITGVRILWIIKNESRFEMDNTENIK